MVVGERYELSPAARRVDAELARIDGELDWLRYFTPTNMEALDEGFRGSGCRTLPDIDYPDIGIDLDTIRGDLLALPIHDIDDPLIEVLLIEKQREIDRQIELIRMRGQEGIEMASIDLFGTPGPRMRDRADRIMAEVPARGEPEHDADKVDFIVAAREEMERLGQRATDFGLRVIATDNPGVGLFTAEGNLHVPPDYTVAANRVEPLIQHEIGTHSVTYHNGGRQPLRTLATGLADYDTLQEGIAVLAEYLAGYLPPRRLRELAARVIAADMAAQGEAAGAIYTALRDHDLWHERAFDTAVRAKRGGCFTKDWLYLKGFVELIAYLHHGGEMEPLFLGKFAMKHIPTLDRLRARGLIQDADLLPGYLLDDRAIARIDKVRTGDLTDLFHESPCQ